MIIWVIVAAIILANVFGEPLFSGPLLSAHARPNPGDPGGGGQVVAVIGFLLQPLEKTGAAARGLDLL